MALVLLYAAHYRQRDAEVQGDGRVPEATLAASEDSFSVASGVGSSTASVGLRDARSGSIPTFWLVLLLAGLSS